MTIWKRRTIVLVVTAFGVASAACGDSAFAPGAGPTAPGPNPAQPAGELIRGSVFDTAVRAVAGARVEIVDGPQAGSSTTTDSNGAFSLTGTFDDNTRFRASKEGHVDEIRRLEPPCAACNPRRWIHFNLDVVAPPLNITGSYTLTFVADSSCATLPSEARTRSYAAIITPSSYRPNTAFEVRPADAPFIEPYNSFTITVAGDYAALWLGNAHGDPGLVERIAPNTYLAFEGSAVAPAVTDASNITFSLQGFVEHCELGSEMGSAYSCSAPQVVTRATCTAPGHRVILTKR
jgi:Carboxypeptidase regulatory-like domain